MANIGEVQYRFKRNKSKAFVAFEAALRGKYGDTGGMIFSVENGLDPDYLDFTYGKKWDVAEEFNSSAFQKTRELEVYDVILDQMITSGKFDQQQAEAFCSGVSEILSGDRFSDGLVLAVGNEEVDMEVEGYNPEVSKFFQSHYGIKLPHGLNYDVYTDSDEIRAQMVGEDEVLFSSENIKQMPLSEIESDRDDDSNYTECFNSIVPVLLPDLKAYLAPQNYVSICAALMEIGLGQSGSITEADTQAIQIAYNKFCHAHHYQKLEEDLRSLQKEILSGSYLAGACPSSPLR